MLRRSRRYVGRRQVDHEQASIGIDRDMALAADDLLSRVIAALLGPGAFTDWLSITPAVGLAARPDRSRSIISATSWMVRNSSSGRSDGTTNGPSVRAGNPSAAFASRAGAGHIADHVQYLAQINLGLAALPGRLRQ